MPKTGEPRSVDAFLRLVLRSGLLESEPLKAALRTVPAGHRDDPEIVAAHLVKLGKLSQFQARKLLGGMSAGLVVGPFQVLAPVGRGAMGSVYLVRDTRSSQLLALKVLPPGKARTEERMVARFRREMELCRRVSHPYLAQTFEAGEAGGVHYIAMEYIPGRTLFRLVADVGPLAVPRLARLMMEVATGLQYAHSQGLIHRDLKPGNIMVTPHDHAKVLDLGLAIVAGETGDKEIVGGQGYVVGTMDYISPEQIGNPIAVDGRADIYSLGCTMYFALTGRPPFVGGTSKEKMHRHRTEEPRPVNVLNPAVPPAFAAVVTRMMAKDAAQRFPTAEAVTAELQRWAGEQTVAPLDRPDDVAFANAVAALEAAEPLAEMLEDAALDRAGAVILPTAFLQKYRGQKRRGEKGFFGWLFHPWVMAGIILVAVVIALVVAAAMRD